MNVLLARVPLFWAGCGTSIILLYMIFSGQQRVGSMLPYDQLSSKTSWPSDEGIANSTLGFQKIFVLNMPSRHDKRDAMSVSASVSDMEFEWLDGVDGAAMTTKSKPAQVDPGLVDNNSTLGCWRAHMNAMQRIVKDRIQSALIMEDDADWDVNVRAQLVEFARGAKFIQELGDTTTKSPYGDDWDVIWLGHCGLPNNNHAQRIWLVRDDPTAVPPELWDYTAVPNLSGPTLNPAFNGTFNRYVYGGRGGRCLYAYAVSLRGARTFLDVETMSGVPAYAVDRGMARLCSGADWGAKCIGVWPALFGSHKAAGPMSKDSDRETIKNEWRKVGLTKHVVFSTRLNLKSMIGVRGMQPRKLITSQFPDYTLVKDFSGNVDIPKGKGIWVEESEFANKFTLPPQMPLQ